MKWNCINVWSEAEDWHSVSWNLEIQTDINARIYWNNSPAPNCSVSEWWICMEMWLHKTMAQLVFSSDRFCVVIEFPSGEPQTIVFILLTFISLLFFLVFVFPIELLLSSTLDNKKNVISEQIRFRIALWFYTKLCVFSIQLSVQLSLNIGKISTPSNLICFSYHFNTTNVKFYGFIQYIIKKKRYQF